MQHSFAVTFIFIIKLSPISWNYFAIVGIANITCLLLLVLYIFTVVGVGLFAKVCMEHIVTVDIGA
jgi:hypothetical protein